MSYTLVPFDPCPFIGNFIADFSLGQHIQCEWRMDGNIDLIRWPSVTDSPSRVRGLWESTCFEWFYGPLGQGDYIEFNLAPTQDWHAFSFTGLREGMVDAEGIEPLSVTVHHSSREAFVQLKCTMGHLSRIPAHLGLSAVIEDVEGTRHYFALAHNTPMPDFHHPDNHVALGDHRP